MYEEQAGEDERLVKRRGALNSEMAEVNFDANGNRRPRGMALPVSDA